MIAYEGPGNILTSTRQTLVCPVNVVGTMGKGLAKSFADTFPGLLTDYLTVFPRRSYLMRVDAAQGRRLVVGRIDDARQCLFFPTKLHWRDSSPIGLIVDNLKLLQRVYQELGITSLAVPALGCGEGGLEYCRVRPIFQRAFEPLPIEVDILLHAPP